MFCGGCVLDPVPFQSTADLDRLAIVQDFAIPDLNAVCSAMVQLGSTKLDLGHLVVAILESLVEQLCCCL